jgi:hypothetical protein
MDFMSNDDFCAQRSEILKEILALKHSRRVALGPDMTVVFEHPRLIWWHIQEMLRLENGGAEQLQEEWAVFAPLLPSPDYITLTMMIEIHDPVLRKKELRKRAGIEHALFLEGAGFRIRSEPVDMGAEQTGAEQTGAEQTGAGQKSVNASLQHKEKDSFGPDQAVQTQGDIIGPESGVQDQVQLKGGAEQSADPSAYPKVEQSVGSSVEQEVVQAAGHGSCVREKTSAVHFLRFPLTQWERQIFAMGEPILSCGHPHALYRTPIAMGLWNALCHEIGVTPLKY